MCYKYPCQYVLGIRVLFLLPADIPLYRFRHGCIYLRSTSTLHVSSCICHFHDLSSAVIALTVGAASGIGLLYVATPVLVSALSMCFVTFSGVCIVVLNSAVIDVFPTHLRCLYIITVDYNVIWFKSETYGSKVKLMVRVHQVYDRKSLQRTT